MPVKVLHVIDHLGYGGAPIVVKGIVENAPRDRVENIVLALRANPRPLPIDAEVITLAYHKYSPRVFHALPEICRRNGVDIIHAHLQKSIITALLASRRCDIPVIVHGHGPIFSGGFGLVYRMMLRILRRRICRVIANSKATQTAMHRAANIPLDSIDVIENFIDTDRFNPARYDRDEARARLKLQPEDIAVGFVGRFDFCKGIDLLLQAGKLLLEGDPAFRFVLVGYGKEEPALRRLAESLGIDERVIFTGLLENPAQAIAGFDLAVMPSRREAFGIVAVELMAMRVPVIASTVGGLPELINHEETGLLLTELSPEAIAEGIRRLAADEDLRNYIIGKAAELARRFNGDAQVRRITEIYLELGRGESDPVDQNV